MSAPAFISVRGRRTRVRIAGDPAGPPVLMLHGIGRSLEDWAPQYPRLAQGYRLISLDLPGFGFSERSPEPTTLQVLARGALETLDALGEQRPLHVLGNSLGGAVAQQLLVLDAARVASLVLVNSAGFGSEVALPIRLLTVPVLGRLATRRPSRAGARRAERLSFADPGLATPARIDHALAIARRPDPGVVLLETVRELGTLRGTKPHWRAELMAAGTENPRPTLIIWGDRDRVLPARHLDSARRLLPHAETHLFTGIGHMPQIECPDAFADRVLAFLAEIDRSGQHDSAGP
ncbi:alpha/beta fold hydrolase [Streptomyces griseorubiginosus]|uniref:alpha/beta fold hydrolase n=1 Tax=Streptomyces griseorubiginosus TaxID=67304 RepID=UPI00076D86DD|nr:alpha/beta fold hydrolase [Streptomyces griseorubiginosus]KUM68118.1 alpha/beta hydrolase [Streptomyces griseorubiginosus]